MQLKTFNATNSKTTRKGLPSLSFNIKTGVMMINKSGMELIGVKSGDMVQMLQDEQDAENWYLEKVKKDGFALRGKEGGGIYFNSTSIVRQLFESVGCEAGSGSALIAGLPTKFEGRQLYGIITAKLKA